MAKKVAQLPKREIRRIQEAHKRVFFRGTPEKFYADSGFWEYIKYVKTKDEHDPNAGPKPFPIEKKYLQWLYWHLLNLDMLMIPKSRQVMLTWAMAAFMSWFAKTGPNQQTLLQSKKEDDANEVVSHGRTSPGVGRIDYIEQNLPSWLKDPHLIGGAGNQVGLLTYSPLKKDKSGVFVRWHGSRIKALPGGADQVASRTGSFLGEDEASFLDDFAETWERAAPAMMGKPGETKMVAWSSVYGGSEFNDYILESDAVLAPGQPLPMPENTGIPSMKPLYDKLGGLPKGMRSWVTPSGIPVLEIHYSADPEKDPATDVGKAWVEEFSKRFKGGIKSPRWQREMEIDYEATPGDLVFEHLSAPDSPVFVPEISLKEARQRMSRFAIGYDYGTRNPSAMIVSGQDAETGDWYALWELYEPCLDYKLHSEKIRECPYYKLDLAKQIICDPAMKQRHQHTEAGLKSMIELFSKEDVVMVPGRKGADMTLISLLKASWGEDGEKAAQWEREDEERRYALLNGEKPPVRGRRYHITSGCPNLKREIRNLKWDKHASAATDLKRNALERVMDKNNHTVDAWAYPMDMMPEGDAARRGSGGNFTLAIYREQMARERRREEIRSAYIG